MYRDVDMHAAEQFNMKLMISSITLCISKIFDKETEETEIAYYGYCAIVGLL